jgi:hypothetical protein
MHQTSGNDRSMVTIRVQRAPVDYASVIYEKSQAFLQCNIYKLIHMTKKNQLLLLSLLPSRFQLQTPQVLRIHICDLILA